MSRLALQLTCYNGSRYLPHLFASLAAQTFKDWTLYVLDNGSNEEERVAIKVAVDAAAFPTVFERVDETLNFANGHNHLFKKHDVELVQLLNDDAMLEPTYLQDVVTFMDAHPSYASVSGRIFRWDFDRVGSVTKGKTDIIDSLGLERRASGKVAERFCGVPLVNIPERQLNALNVFGVSGCLPMYRRSMVLASSPDETLFDPSFVSYKEDVEIAHRFEAIGVRSAIVQSAVAYHRRTFTKNAHAAQVFAVQLQSYRNHLWTLFVHWSARDVFRRAWALLPFEFAKLCYWLLRRPTVVIDAWKQTRHEWANILRKRERMQQIRETHSAGRFVPLVHLPAPYTFAIITVSHNDLNERYFTSLKTAIGNTKERVQLIVVDNASTAYAANELVDQYFEKDAVTILRNGDFGFGRSSNRGIQEARAQYVLFLNPDTVISDDQFFDRLKTFLDANPQAGIVAPRIHHHDGELQETCRRFPRWFMPFVQRTGLGKSSFGERYAATFLMRDYDHQKARMVDWAQGSALCISQPLLEELGGFDDRFWMYFEDIDLCRRVWNTGHPVYYFPETHIRHAYGKASAAKKNFIWNALTNSMAHAHIVSWLKYQWKWKTGDYL
jgi:N-acetylglucosaminyl-diphospho-decaprenol L-rhamnosyltransferase